MKKSKNFLPMKRSWFISCWRG